MAEHPTVTLRKELQEVLDKWLNGPVPIDNATLSAMLSKRVEAAGWVKKKDNRFRG